MANLFRCAIVLIVFVVTATAVSIPSASTGICITKLQRRAWHTFTTKEKRDYVDAELCLMKLPATLGLPGTKNRFEELQSIHQIQAGITHGVGAFLPYHRLYMHAHEQLIRNECGYQGAQPYWDEVRDAGNFSNSVVLDPVTGFGGDGVGPQGCIVDGPFANYTNGLGPGYKISNNCIYRFVNDTLSIMAGREYIDACYEKTTFTEFWRCAEMAPHNGGHSGVGGKLLDPIASPGDPIFYLHHTWLDKIFWEWQALDLPARLTDIGGPTMQMGLSVGGAGAPAPFIIPGSAPGAPGEFPFPGAPGGPGSSGPPLIMPSPSSFPPPDALRPLPGSPPQQPEGDPGNVTTLTHILNMFGVIPNATIADVMDIGGALLCYEYV